MTDRHPIWDTADQIQMDLRNAQAKLVQLRAYLAAQDLGDPAPTTFINGPVTADSCESCGVGGGNHTHDCGALHLSVARAHIPSQEQA